MDTVLDFSLLGKKKKITKIPAVKTSTAFGARLICKYEERRSAVNAMADGSRRSLNIRNLDTVHYEWAVYFQFSFFFAYETSHMACNSTGY